MYLKSITINNFRKFRDENNIVEFVGADYTTDGAPNPVNIADKVTLIVGKNNTGKTTIVNALNKIVSKKGFKATDFNFAYLKEIMNNCITKQVGGIEKRFNLPELRFVLKIGLDLGKNDIITNLIPFVSISDVSNSDAEDAELDIIIKWEVVEKEKFKEEFKAFCKQKEYLEKLYKDECEKEIKSIEGQCPIEYRRGTHREMDNIVFNEFLKAIDRLDYKITYYNSNNDQVRDFKLENLIEISSIDANIVKGNNSLSEAFSKIVELRYKKVMKSDSIDRLNRKIYDINRSLTLDIDNNHSKDINESLENIISSDKFQVLLRADLNFEKLIKSVIKYEYLEGEANVPEEQYGLGYTNLMMIIAKIISYMEKYPSTAFNSQINLIIIEEPEVFMHPQMQEQFINNINGVIDSLLNLEDKNINSQIIITTHSSHILSSKIREGNTFNNINYINSVSDKANSIPLSDKKIIPNSNNAKEDLKFLRKHISYYISEVFFADAVIFVEGITEYTLLNYYLKQDNDLRLFYITVIMINGAHAHVYKNLIKLLKIPTLIITDLDIKRDENEKTEKEPEGKEEGKEYSYLQIGGENLGGRETTNNTLISYTEKSKIKDLISSSNLKRDNLMVTTQKEPIKSYYATTFEEALILSNAENNLLNKVIKKLKPEIYNGIMDGGGMERNSYKLYRKLSSSKSDLANELLYNIILEEDQDKIPTLPKYIRDGLNFLLEKLGGH